MTPFINFIYNSTPVIIIFLIASENLFVPEKHKLNFYRFGIFLVGGIIAFCQWWLVRMQ
jgi:hypothetical protein